MGRGASLRNTGLVISTALLVGTVLASPLRAADDQSIRDNELLPGTVISAANIDNVQDALFEGKRIGDMLPERLEWQIRNHELKITLKQSKESYPSDPRLISATKKYSQSVSVDPNTFLLSGYKAGTPFPEIEPNDPTAAVKIVWNFTYAQPHGDSFGGGFTFNLVDGEAGIERIQQWVFSRYYMTGRITGDPVEGDGSIYHKSLLFATYPQDIKGLGTFSIRYNEPRFDDIWAYIRTVRRIRRLSGGAWMDPIGGTDQLQDDLETFNAHPAWYEQYKLLGKRWVLGVIDGASQLPDWRNRGAWVKDAATLQDQFPYMDLETAPHWNPKDLWEPREVWVVESIPPEYHPYSRKINYFDAELWRPMFAETYDRKGEFWKWMTYGSRLYQTADGYIDPSTGQPVEFMFAHWGVNIDFQRRHATFFNVPAPFDVNVPGKTSADWSLSVLEAAGR